MAESPTTGTARKLGVEEGARLLLVHPPPGWGLSWLPRSAQAHSLTVPPRPADRADGTVVVAFYADAASYLGDLPALARFAFPSTALWVAWPRRAAGHRSDLTDSVVRDPALELGLVDNKVAAVDHDWSGLRFTWRRELRSAPPPSILG